MDKYRVAERPVETTTGGLIALLTGFDQQPARCRQVIRELLDGDPEAFYGAAVHALENMEDSRGYRHLVSVLLGRDLLVRVLSDRKLSRAKATALLRSALQIDPMVDVSVARGLARFSGKCPASHDPARVMEIVGEVSETAMPSSLQQMIRHPDPYLRSKAVLMLGRRAKSASWLQLRLREQDARIRANAVESFWGCADSESRELLRGATQDPNNRVAGNAVLAMYRLGETGTIRQIFAMATHTSHLFRATAAWIMGETVDPRFAGTLARMMGDTSDIVRKRALSGLQRFKAARARLKEEWRISGQLSLESSGERALALTLAEPFAILPTQIAVFEGGHAVIDYSVEGEYSVKYTPVCPTAPTVRVRIHAPEAWAECEIPISQ